MRTGTSRHEIDFLFKNSRFNVETVENIVTLCKVLAKYMVVDKTIFDKRCNNKIGFSYLRKAIENHIITEMQHQDGSEKKNIFYYKLGMGGTYLLEKMRERYIDLNIGIDKEMYGRILAFNYFALENDYDIDLNALQDMKHRFFCCRGGVICYFPKDIKEIQIIRMLIPNLATEEETPTPNDIKEKFNFIPINKDLIDIGCKTKTTVL